VPKPIRITDAPCQSHTAFFLLNRDLAIEKLNAAPAASFQRRLESICIVMKASFVYILASKKHGTLYTGVTSNLPKRVAQHRQDALPGFTSRYGVHRLVWFEVHGDIGEAIRREKQIKAWHRRWKIRMIEETNPEWKDLYGDII